MSNGIYFPDDPSGVFASIHMPDFGISWAGANPFEEGFCLGSETGNIAFTNLAGKAISYLGQASESGEAINGIAWSNRWLVATTRGDINFIGPWTAEGPSSSRSVVILGGALGVAAAPSGHFVLPLGKAGIMLIKPGINPKEPVTVTSSDKEFLNISSVLPLLAEDGSDLIVCAGRRAGLGYTHFREGLPTHSLSTGTFDGIDIVDVCSIGTAENAFAVAAAGIDGSLVFSRNVLNDKSPQIVKYRSVKGTVYRVLSARGDLFLLTSEALFVLVGIAAKFLDLSVSGTISTDILRIPIEASDANLVNQRWLLATGVDDLYRLDVEKMPRSPDTEVAEPIDARTVWEEARLSQKKELLAASN